jgi:hypothetical protein
MGQSDVMSPRDIQFAGEAFDETAEIGCLIDGFDLYFR